MPEVIENIDRQRMNEVRRMTVKGARLWLDLYVACANGDVDGARGIWKHIRDVSVAASDALKAVGAEKAAKEFMDRPKQATGAGDTPNG